MNISRPTPKLFPTIAGLSLLTLSPLARADVDHQGQNWSPGPGEVHWGRHYNIHICTIDNVLQVGPPTNGDASGGGGQLIIEANFINVNSAIDGAGRGYGGGGGGGGAGGGDQVNMGQGKAGGSGVNGGNNISVSTAGQNGNANEFYWGGIRRLGKGGRGGQGGSGGGIAGYAGTAFANGGGGGDYDGGSGGSAGNSASGGPGLRIGSGGAGGGGGGGGGSPCNLTGGGGGGGSAGGAGGAMIILKANYKITLAGSGVIDTRGSAGNIGQNGESAGGANKGSGGAAGVAIVGLATGGKSSGGPQYGSSTDASNALTNSSVAYAPRGGAGGEGGGGSGGGIQIQAPIFEWAGKIWLYGSTGAGNAGSIDIGTGPNGDVTYGSAAVYHNPDWSTRSNFTRTMSPPLVSASGGVTSASSNSSETISISVADPLIPDQTIQYLIDDPSKPTSSWQVYSGPFAVASNCTIRAISVAAHGWSQSSQSTPLAVSFEVLPPVVSRSPQADFGLYHTTPTSVTLAPNPGQPQVPGYEIRYTTNGDSPTQSSFLYQGPIPVDAYTELRARAFAANRVPSGMILDVVSFKVATPTLSKVPNQTDSTTGRMFYYEAAPYNVVATSSSPGVAFHYTTDRSQPTQASSLAVSGQIPINYFTSLRVRAIRSGWEPSDIVPADSNGYEYRVGAGGSVTFSPLPGLNTSNAPIFVTMTCPPGQRIVYTTGRTPEDTLTPEATNTGQIVRGTEYVLGSQVLVKTNPTWIKARCFAAGFEQGTVSVGTWSNIGKDASMGAEIVRPTGSVYGSFPAPSPGIPVRNGADYANSGLPSSVILTSLVSTSGTATATSSADHGFAVGDPVEIAGATQTTFNGHFVVITVPTTKSFTFACQATGTATGSLSAQSFRVGDWQNFVFIPNANNGNGGVFAAVPKGATEVIKWWFPDLAGADKFVEFEHKTLDPDPAEVMTIYHTEGSGMPTHLPVDLTQVPNPIIHYNGKITGRVDGTGRTLVNQSPFFWLAEDKKLRASQQTGQVLIEYQDGPNGPYVGVQVVEIKGYQPDPYIGNTPNYFDADIGDELQPYGKRVPDGPGVRLLSEEELRPDLPLVTRGRATPTGDNKQYIYQHTAEGPFQGHVFAVRKNTAAYSQMEVIWTRRDQHGRAVWPYEIRQYKADWPNQEKMQTYVVTTPGQDPGDRAEIPVALTSAVMDYQEQWDDAGKAVANRHASIVSGNAFNSYVCTRGGLSLLKMELTQDANAEDWVGFKVIRSVSRNDFNLTPVDNRIGVEITDAGHLSGVERDDWNRPPFPGYIYESRSIPLDDRFLPELYGNNPSDFVNPGKGQIFAVNTGTLEVWWHNRYRDDRWPANLKIDWPSLVKRYNNRWPTTEELTKWTDSNGDGIRQPEEESRAIVDIADQTGTGALNPGVFNDWYIYYQNTISQRGYNPNDEHAFKWPVQDGEGAFALRNDLGSPATSEPHLILPYRLKADSAAKWNLLVYRVEAGDFRYIGTAGTRVQPPLPLNSFTDLEKSYALPGYEKWWFKDRNKELWARAGGDDGGLSTLVSRYFYANRPDQGFYFPPGYTLPTDGKVPWLDILAKQRDPSHPAGEPIDITYRVRWPDYPTPASVPARPEPSDPNNPTADELAALAAYDKAIADISSGDAWKQQVLDTFASENLHGLGDGSQIAWRPVPELLLGETLVHAKKGLPSVFGDGVSGRKSVEIGYDQSVARGGGKSVKLIDPTWTYKQSGITNLPPEVKTAAFGGKKYFLDLPPHLQSRLWYDPDLGSLVFTGEVKQVTLGSEPYYVLLNVVSPEDRNRILAICSPSFSGGSAFRTKLNVLCDQASAVRQLGNGSGQFPLLNGKGDVNFSSFALTAADPEGDGYVTMVFDDNSKLADPADPVSLEVIRVARRLFTGELRVQFPPSPFDEKLTLKHSSDFGGVPDGFWVQWRFRPGFLPAAVQQNLNNWPNNYLSGDWTSFTRRQPSNGSGASEAVIGGASRETLSDNYFIARYKPKVSSHPLYTDGKEDTDVGWSAWTKPQLAEGWIKRVMAGINPFEQRYGNYRTGEVNTTTSLVEQIGKAWEGNIPFNLNGIDNYGLLEIYETVLNRGLDLSIHGTPVVDYAPANQALMLAAGRISDLYLALGNEAFADEADPTIAFGTGDGQFGAQASTLHCFMNQTSSLGEENLALLRGRDDSALPGTQLGPVYNRLIWNLTRDIRGGEAAYVLNYGIRDQTWSRFVPSDAAYSTIVDDAARMYPQGHGDAWGHYLSASKTYYKLLTDSNFSWVSQPEAVTVGNAAVMVDYEDERRFAKIAAAKARTGAEIVNLTYRNDYTEDPAATWDGYNDKKEGRNWGVNEWALRAGQAAYFDWVVGNAIIPSEDPDVSHTGISKIDRTTVPELAEISASYIDIQAQLNNVDAGLNPLGVSSDAVPFDISPDELTGASAKTHFEQIYSRAVEGLNNAIRVFNQAYASSQRLRQQNDDVATFQRQAEERRTDFKNRLVELFGYPYPADMGTGKIYPTDYDGPDLYHYMYYDASNLVSLKATGGEREVTKRFLTKDIRNAVGGNWPDEIDVKLNVSTDGLGFVKPKSYTTPRKAEGELQLSHSDLLQSLGRFKRALVEYDNLLGQIGDQNRVISAQAALNSADQAAANAEVRILNSALKEQETLNEMIAKARDKQTGYQNKAAYSTIIANAIAEFLPTSTGLAPDVASAGRGAIRQAGGILAQVFSEQAQEEAGKELALQQAKEGVSAQSNIDIVIARNGVLDDRANAALAPLRAQLSQLLRNKSSLELEIYNAEEAMNQASNRYMASLAKGQRLLEELNTFQANTASDVQQYRYRDTAFRIFRDEALQKYRAQFDLAARYVYLAAKAYDYETGLLNTDSRSAVAFFNQVVSSQTIGLIQDGQPVTGPITGDPGLADAMARMLSSWSVLKGRLGFNNPTPLSAEMSLRYEAFRILPGEVGNKIWRETLKSHWVDDLNTVPEYRLYCIPPQGGTSAKIPALVIPFETAVNSGFNVFNWPLAGADHAFPSSHYAVKIKAAGVGFSNYDSVIGGLAATPYAYLIPAGEDKMRVPTDQFSVRSWQVMDQMIPVPFPIGNLEIQDPGYLPMADSLNFAGNAFGRIRKFPEMPVYHDGAQAGFNPGASGVLSSRLIGRSVWNSRWVLIIPGTSLKADGVDGLKQLIDGRLENGVRTGDGISDLKIRFDAYSYSGN